jgi:hypothetical protein
MQILFHNYFFNRAFEISIPGTKGSAKLSIFGFSTKVYEALAANL